MGLPKQEGVNADAAPACHARLVQLAKKARRHGAARCILFKMQRTHANRHGSKKKALRSPEAPSIHDVVAAINTGKQPGPSDG
jgi:hypothetical protein